MADAPRGLKVCNQRLASPRNPNFNLDCNLLNWDTQDGREEGSGGSGRNSVTCSQSASWSFTPAKVDRQSFIA